MPVDPVVDSLDNVPEALQTEYEQREDGKYTLKLSSAPPEYAPKGQLDEFRSNNRDLKSQLDQMKEQAKQYEGIDVEKARQLLQKQEEIDKKKLYEQGDVDTIVQRQVEQAVTPLQEQLQEAQNRTQTAEQERDRIVTDMQIVQEANAPEIGHLNPGAEDALVQQAKKDGWQNVQGKLVQVDNDGQTVYSQERPAQPRSIQEWLRDEALTKYGWMWQASQGGGGSGQSEGQGPTTQIQRDDREGFRKNLDDIATGKIRVVES